MSLVSPSLYGIDRRWILFQYDCWSLGEKIENLRIKKLSEEIWDHSPSGSLFKKNDFQFHIPIDVLHSPFTKSTLSADQIFTYRPSYWILIQILQLTTVKA